jgi:aspartate/methionine/tyrosine aminotransferase
MAQKIGAYRGELYQLQIGDTYVLPPDDARLGPEVEFGPECYRYGPTAGHPRLLAGIVAKLRERNGFSWATPDHVQVTAGASHGLFVALRAILDPDDDVLIPSPYWPLLPGMVKLCGAAVREAPFYSRLYDDPGADPRALLEPHLGERTVAIYLTTPNNPDGKVLSTAQLERVAELARERDLWIIADEVYEDYLYGETPHVSIAALPGMAERTLTAFSFSKSHAMAGLRLGYFVGPPSVIATARKISNHTVYCVPFHLQRAAASALADGRDFIARTHREYRAARDEVLAALAAPCHPPEGASYLFLDLSRFVPRGSPDCVPVLERALEAGVLLAPGEAFGRGFEHYARLCFTSVRRDRLREAIARLNQVLEDAARCA